MSPRLIVQRLCGLMSRIPGCKNMGGWCNVREGLTRGEHLFPASGRALEISIRDAEDG